MPLLARHPASDCKALRRVEARVAASPLRVTYVLEGELDELRIPPPRPAHIAERLWRHTCCEIFIARPRLPQYHEFNFAPSGEWAAYAFARYREGALLRDAALDPQIRVRRSAGRLELDALILAPFDGKLLIGLAAVIEERDGRLSYWALRHPPGKPDFHHREAFALELDETRD